MRVVITGGTGLIGAALASELFGAGHDVLILSRSLESSPAAGLELRLWDARTASDLVPAIDGSDAVVHLTGENIGAGRWTAARKSRILDSRIDSTRALSEAIDACTSKPPVVVQASAVGYYGPGDGEVDEESEPGSDFLAGVCREWEAAGASIAEMGVRRVVVRTGVVLSRAGGALPRMVLPFHLFAGGAVGSGLQWLPWIHWVDEVAAIRFLLENENATGPYNLSAPEPVSNSEFSHLIAMTLHRPGFMRVPSAVLRAVLGEMSTLVLDGVRAMPRRLREAGFHFRHPDAETALRDLLA